MELLQTIYGLWLKASPEIQGILLKLLTGFLTWAAYNLVGKQRAEALADKYRDLVHEIEEKKRSLGAAGVDMDKLTEAMKLAIKRKLTAKLVGSPTPEEAEAMIKATVGKEQPLLEAAKIAKKNKASLTA